MAIDATSTTAPDEWRRQSSGNRQGSQGVLDVAVAVIIDTVADLALTLGLAEAVGIEAVDEGVAVVVDAVVAVGRALGGGHDLHQSPVGALALSG